MVASQHLTGARRFSFIMRSTAARGTTMCWPKRMQGDSAAGDGSVCAGAWNPEGHHRICHGHGQPRRGCGRKDSVWHWVSISR